LLAGGPVPDGGARGVELQFDPVTALPFARQRTGRGRPGALEGCLPGGGRNAPFLQIEDDLPTRRNSAAHTQLGLSYGVGVIRHLLLASRWRPGGDRTGAPRQARWRGRGTWQVGRLGGGSVRGGPSLRRLRRRGQPAKAPRFLAGWQAGGRWPRDSRPTDPTRPGSGCELGDLASLVV